MDIEEAPSQKKCQKIKKILQDIRDNIKQSGKNNTDVLQPFQQLMDLKLLFRDVAMELEARRQLAKNKKQQIQKSKTYLDRLEYYKSMLKAQIDICQVDVEDISGIVEQSFDLQWTERFPALRNNIHNWIQDSKNQKQKLSEEKVRRETIQSQVDKKKKLYKDELPNQLKKISENLTQIVGIFGISPVHQLNPIKNRKLIKIFNFFQPLKESDQIQMQYSEEIISVTIYLKSNNKIFKQCEEIKCPTQQKSIKINFLCILQDVLVAGVDRSSDFNNEQIFHRLINEQPITRLFLNPKTQEQRNNNNRYVRFKWLDSIANSRQNLEMSCSEFVTKVVDRIIALGLTRYLITSLKENKFLFYFRVMRQGENGSVHLKKFTVQSLIKISFEEFKKLIYIPHWSQQHIKGQNNLLKSTQNNLKKSAQSTISWIELLNQLNLEQVSYPRMYEYYKVSIQCHQNIVLFVIILPFNYPEKQCTIKIIDIGKKKQQKRIVGLPQCVLSVNPTDVGMSVQNQIHVQSIQNQLNENLHDFVNKNPHFGIFYQINRLITLLQEIHTSQSNKECVISKLFQY